MSQTGSEINSGGIDDARKLRFSAGMPAQQLPGNRSHLGVEITRPDHLGDEAWAEYHIRVEGKKPISASQANTLVLRPREPSIILVENDVRPFAPFFQNSTRPVG